MWLLVCTILVVLMQAGFACLECGLVRAKNSVNVAMKNLTDFLVSSLLFWAFGFAIMFGASQWGLFGFGSFGVVRGDVISPEQGALTAFFFFQMAFCGTATTIVSGAVAERISFAGYIVISALVSGIIYPIFGHWAWGGIAAGVPSGWLEQLGFIDFAGSTVVHSIGGWVGLAAVLTVGARIGRFDNPDGLPGHNPAYSILGAFLLWVGWFGFNGGSTLALNDTVPVVMVHTLLAGSAGGCAALMVSALTSGRPDAIQTMNGVLAGLVAVTASAHICDTPGAIAIGAVGGVVQFGVGILLERLRIDDAVGAVPVHLGAGVWGTAAVALFGDTAAFGGHTRLEQLFVQGTGIGAAALLAFPGTYLLLKFCSLFVTFRVSAEAELGGLNASEHGMTDQLGALLREMERDGKSGDFSQAASVRLSADSSSVAAQYEKVRSHFFREVHRREQMAQELRQAQSRLDDAIEHLNDGLVIWDKNDCLVVCNQRFKTLYPSMADLNVPGMPFEKVIRGAIARGLFPEAIGREGQWIAERIVRHRSANATRIHQLQNGGWVRVSEQRTAEGGIVALHADVSEQKNAEIELRHAHEHLKTGSAALAAIVEQAVSGVGVIKNSTVALASGAADLSARTEEQVSSLEEMAASIRQLAATVHSNAENAQLASQLAIEARNAADRGGNVVGSVVTAMAQIEESTRRISEVVGMIEEIAFQTNLLALNAAVEAARAGDAGRGFAVVASEVRALAEKASRASRDVKALIAGSNSQVRQGSDLVRQAGDTLSTIVASVKRVAEIVESIASASREQSAGVQQVDEAVSEVEGAANKNSELVVETTAALTEVDRQLEDLLWVINAARPATGAEVSDISGPQRHHARAAG